MYKTVDKQHSEPVVPYPTNGESLEEWKQEADALVEEVESEGIVLLKNEGEVLPLAKGNKLSLFSRSSVDLVLGGTGAGGIDPSKTVDLKTALEEDGEFEVNNTLWDFYKTYDGKDGYIRSNGSYSGALPEDIFTAEVPQSEYTDAVKASYADYNDAAVVVISRVGGEGSDMPAGDFGDGTKYLALQEQEKELLRSIQESGQFKKRLYCSILQMHWNLDGWIRKNMEWMHAYGSVELVRAVQEQLLMYWQENKSIWSFGRYLCSRFIFISSNAELW